MLTALDAVPDRVRGLETGADDYLPKPFDFDELIARISALHRRDKVHKERIVRVAHLEIDTTTRRVLCAGREISLTPREYSLLEALAQNEGRTLTREVIQYRVWNDDESLSNTVDVYIAMLRKKVDSGREAKLIHTVHGLGYTLKRPEVEADS
jgi:two-component system copper resistance phosphate regulon response regulator CusR